MKNRCQSPKLLKLSQSRLFHVFYGFLEYSCVKLALVVNSGKLKTLLYQSNCEVNVLLRKAHSFISVLGRQRQGDIYEF